MALAHEHDPMSLVPQSGDSVGDPLRLDAMRSWLLNGIHMVDSRRRFGSHGRARELLVLAGPVSRTASERWQALAAALHRHTVRGGLSELSPDQRRVITLAYLEGRTNGEIAAMLGVSVRTVRRRLWTALGLLEAYIGRTGAWLSGLILVAAAYGLRPATRLGRWATTAATSTDRAQMLTATVAASAMSAAVLGFVAFTAHSARPSGPPPATTVVTQTSVAGTGAQTLPPSGGQPLIVAKGSTTPARIPEGREAASAPDRHSNNGCDGNPTSAPPSVPVGPRKGHPSGAPVTHPDAGGCRVQD